MSKKAIWITVIILVLVIGILAIMLWVYNSTLIWKSGAHFSQYSKDFITVKDYVASNYPNETDKYLAISLNTDREYTLYDPETNEYLRLPDNIAASLQVIANNGFPTDYTLEMIQIHGNRITFSINQGEYVLAYSPDGKPTWLNSPKGHRKIHVISIGDGWYHIEEIQ